MNDNYCVVTDPGIDDLIALALLYKINPNANNSLVSSFGNAPESITAKNTKEFIALVAKSWGFCNGSSLPLNGKLDRPWPDYFHGPDGVWGVHPKVSIHNIHNTDITNKNIISLAPMTDPLKLVQKGNIEQITVMGGAFNIEGNETPYAETNIAFDPQSAKLFFESVEGLNIAVVPLDVTRKVYWSHNKVLSIPETNKINSWLKELLLTWFDKYDHSREKDFNLHDPLAVYLNFYPEFAKWVKSGVAVVAEGERSGQTTLTDINPPCKIALDLIDPTKIADSIFEIIFNST